MSAIALLCGVLTVRAAVELQAYSDAALSAPVYRDETDETSQDRMLQLVPDHALTVHVPLKCLKCTEKYTHCWSKPHTLFS